MCFNVPRSLLAALDHQFDEDLYAWNPAAAEQGHAFSVMSMKISQ